MDRTVIRTVTMAAMIIGPPGDVADKVARGFEEARVRVLRASHAAAACERLAVAMPQVVVVLGALRAAEREALADRATAVGALLMHIDPELDQETLDDLIARAAQAAVERRVLRDGAAPAMPSEPSGDDDDVDSQW